VSHEQGPEAKRRTPETRHLNEPETLSKLLPPGVSSLGCDAAWGLTRACQGWADRQLGVMRRPAIQADRMFDMGFEPQIGMFMQSTRPDKQAAGARARRARIRAQKEKCSRARVER